MIRKMTNLKFMVAECPKTFPVTTNFFFYFRSMGIADKPFHVVLLHDPQGFLKIPNVFVPVMELLYGMKEISLWLDLVDKRNYKLIKN